MGEVQVRNALPWRSQWQNIDANERVILDGARPSDLPGWSEMGYPWASACDFWSPRVCGIACLESILLHVGIEPPRRYDLICDAVRHGAYRARRGGGVDGLLYWSFSAWVEAEFGLACEVCPDLRLDRILERLGPRSCLLASVSSEIRNSPTPPSRRGGHIVLVTGVADGDVIFHNPSGLVGSSADVRMPRQEFEKFYADRGVVVSWHTA